MKQDDFHIGQDFYTDTGMWRCTDVGTRVIVAIQLNQKDSKTYAGPPYSIPEHVFDEYDMEACSISPCEDEVNIEELLKNKKLTDIHDAFLFISSAGYGECSAILNMQTAKISLRSDFLDMDEFEKDEDSELEFDSKIHIEIPHKNELELGRNLVFEFVNQFISEDADKVYQIFKKRGAYSRFKDLLDTKGILEQWYDFENKSQYLALFEWCEENEIDITV